MDARNSVEKKILTVVSLCKSVMESFGISNACLTQSVIISHSLTMRGVLNQIIVGYLVFPGNLAIRHVWVHAFPGGIVDPVTEYAAPLNPSYHLDLPKGYDLLDKDSGNEKEHRELEAMLDRVCVMKRGTRVVVDHQTVLSAVTEQQPLWKKVIDALCPR